MHDDLDRVSRLLDVVAAGRDPRDHEDFSAVERHLSETALLLIAARSTRRLSGEEFAGCRRRSIRRVLRRFGPARG
jgi:hypothetical protein